MGGLAGRANYKHVRWKRFDVVKEGSLYRSGQLRMEHLGDAIESLELKTVVCFNSDFVEQEQEICRQRGVDFLYYPMPSDGLGNPESFVDFLHVATDPARQPVLVHCSAGVARTGAAVALYRMSVDGYSADEAIAELRTYEHRGRCEQSLQDHIRAVYRDHLAEGELLTRQSSPETVR